MRNQERHHNRETTIITENTDTAFCPVMEGVPVNKEEAEKEGRVRKYQGKKYYLCCEPCVESFDSSPEAYAK